jgi:hypothetical protein
MISAAIIAALEARKIDYILGARERSSKEVRETVLHDDGAAVPLTIPRQKGETDLAVKEVKVAGRRYIVCRNAEEARKDAETRAALLAGLQRKLTGGAKGLVGNKGFRRFLAAPGDDGFAIDPAKVEADALFDGIFVLRTSLSMSALAVVLRYRNLLTVEQSFLAAKALLATRPVFHRTDAAIRGHIFRMCGRPLGCKKKSEKSDKVGRLRSCVRPFRRGACPLAQMGSATQSQTRMRPREPVQKTGSLDRRSDRLSSHSALPSRLQRAVPAPSADAGRPLCALSWPMPVRSSRWSITPETTRWFDRLKLAEIKLNNRLQGLGQSAVLLVLWQRFQPGGILSLQLRQRGDRVIPALDPASPVGRAADANDRRAAHPCGAVSRLTFGAGHRDITERRTGHSSTPNRYVTK